MPKTQAETPKKAAAAKAEAPKSALKKAAAAAVGVEAQEQALAPKPEQKAKPEEKAKKAMIDAARLADELRAEQEHSGQQEKAKRTLESQIVELEHRLADANEIAAKGGRNAMAKLESRIRELEIELGSVQSRTSETYKAFQKAERRIKELQFQQEEDHKNQDRMTGWLKIHL